MTEKKKELYLRSTLLYDGCETLVSDKQVEKAAKEVNELINEMKFSLIIPRKADYDLATLETICSNWDKALAKLEKAKEIVEDLISQALTEILC
jgi:hypothetical protein